MSEKERGMTDPREALAVLLWEKFGAWPNGPLAAWLTEADCARFADATLAAGWTPPTVKPSVEDVARTLWETDEQEAETTGGALGLPWAALDSLTQHTYRADAKDLLALPPGRTEAEVKAEALREAASAAVTVEEGIPWDHDHDRATVSAWLLGLADRIEKGEGRG